MTVFNRAQSRAHFRRARDEGLAHNEGSCAVDNSHLPAAFTEKAHEAMEALTQARERQEEAGRLHEEASAADTTFNDAIKDTPEKAEALENFFFFFFLNGRNGNTVTPERCLRSR